MWRVRRKLGIWWCCDEPGTYHSRTCQGKNPEKTRFNFHRPPPHRPLLAGAESGKEKTHKHKQIWGLFWDWVGGKILYTCVFWGVIPSAGGQTHKLMINNIPRKSQDSPGNISLMCFVVRWSSSAPKKGNICRKKSPILSGRFGFRPPGSPKTTRFAKCKRCSLPAPAAHGGRALSVWCRHRVLGIVGDLRRVGGNSATQTFHVHLHGIDFLGRTYILGRRVCRTKLRPKNFEFDTETVWIMRKRSEKTIVRKL